MADEGPVNPGVNHPPDTQYVGMANMTNLFEAFGDFKTNMFDAFTDLSNEMKESLRDQHKTIEVLEKKVSEFENNSQRQNANRVDAEPQSPDNTQQSLGDSHGAQNNMHQPRPNPFACRSEGGSSFSNQGRGTYRSPHFSRSEPWYRPDPVRSSMRPNSAPTDINRSLEDTHVRVKNFNAKDTEWLDFKEYFIQIATKANWSDNTCCVKLLAAIDNSLLGVTNGLGPYYNFEQLLAKLDSVNGAEFARREACNKLSSVQRVENESIALYAERVRRLVNRAYSTYSAQAKDEQALKHFIDGLPTKRNFRLNMKLKGFTNLQDAISHGSL